MPVLKLQGCANREWRGGNFFSSQSRPHTWEGVVPHGSVPGCAARASRRAWGLSGNCSQEISVFLPHQELRWRGGCTCPWCSLCSSRPGGRWLPRTWRTCPGTGGWVEQGGGSSLSLSIPVAVPALPVPVFPFILYRSKLPPVALIFHFLLIFFISNGAFSPL